MKNKFMRLAAIMLVLVLATSCFVGGTFAKYVTEGKADDTARVAKFGVTVTATGDEAFKTEYGTTVKSSNEDKLVAPGTNGDLGSVAIAGTPEVSVKVTYEADVTLTGWMAKDPSDAEATEALYFPIVVKVNGTAVDTSDCTTLDAVATAIETAINGTAKTYDPLTNLANESANKVTVTWEWPFSTSDTNDILDTYLGDKAAAGTASTITVVMAATVEQVD